MDARGVCAHDIQGFYIFSSSYIIQPSTFRTIYHDPENCIAAIVTCGSLCPGTNDVGEYMMERTMWMMEQVMWMGLVVISCPTTFAFIRHDPHGFETQVQIQIQKLLLADLPSCRCSCPLSSRVSSQAD